MASGRLVATGAAGLILITASHFQQLQLLPPKDITIYGDTTSEG